MKNHRSPIIGALSDPRLRCISLAGRGLYVDLLRIADALRSPVLRFGDRTPSLDEVSRALGADLDEVKTQIDDLTQFGLIQRGSNGTITVAALAGQFERSEINRANGQRGGRPRKTPLQTNRKPKDG
jgi:endonuclease V-like protein UPF0215 family